MKIRHGIKILLVLMVALFTFGFRNVVQAENVVTVHFFYDESCVHCHEEGLFLDDLEIKYSNLVVVRYEVTTSSENNDLFNEVKSAFGDDSQLTPYTVIGGVALPGFNDQTKRDIETLIGRYSQQDQVDIVQKIINHETLFEDDFDELTLSSGDTIVLPILGEIGIDELSLGLAAVVIGFVDGFNPCAMWVLIFLITMLIREKDRKKMWILGSVFLLSSALMYFAVMSLWLNIALRMTTVQWIRSLIGVFALGFGGYHLYGSIKDMRKKDVGCEVTDEKQKKKIFERVKHAVLQQKLYLALIGIIVLAVSVNMVELACSAGLPLLFTQILAYNDLSTVQHYLYITLYVFFFLIDDLVVFAIAMVTFQVSGISNRYAKASKLIGGIIMAIIGILLLFFPSIIMFQF